MDVVDLRSANRSNPTLAGADSHDVRSGHSSRVFIWSDELSLPWTPDVEIPAELSADVFWICIGTIYRLLCGDALNLQLFGQTRHCVDNLALITWVISLVQILITNFPELTISSGDEVNIMCD